MIALCGDGFTEETLSGIPEVDLGIEERMRNIEETEKAKYLPKQVVEKMQASGYPRFTMHSHTQLWKRLDAKDPAKGLGVMVVNSWYWYQPWLDTVASHCKSNAAEYA